MRFRKAETAQDVIVSCCVLHNMCKRFKKKNKHYTVSEYREQIQISGNLGHNANQIRLQNYLINNYFH